jgi:hypothetical protein
VHRRVWSCPCFSVTRERDAVHTLLQAIQAMREQWADAGEEAGFSAARQVTTSSQRSARSIVQNAPAVPITHAVAVPKAR